MYVYKFTIKATRERFMEPPLHDTSEHYIAAYSYDQAHSHVWGMLNRAGWKIDEIHLSYRSGSGSTHLADAVQDEHNRNIWYLTMPADRNVYEGLFATFSEDANWHTITIEEAANGTVSHAKGGADTGDEVTLTVTPNDFYVLDSISVKDADENEIAVTNGKFTKLSTKQLKLMI